MPRRTLYYPLSFVLDERGHESAWEQHGFGFPVRLTTTVVERVVAAEDALPGNRLAEDVQELRRSQAY